MVCKRTKKWASARFLTVLIFLNACGAKPPTEVDAAAVALGGDARSLSLSWLDTASSEATGADVRRAIADVQAILADTAIVSPSEDLAATCDSTEGLFTAAFVTQTDVDSDANIYICSASKNFGKIFVAQVLIHEALHLRGERDECSVTRMELEIMTSALRIPYKNAYVNECGLN